MKIVDLTPADQLLLDPTGKARKFLSSLNGKGTATPMPDYVRRWSRSQWLSEYLAVRNSYSLNSSYIEYDDEHIGKYAAQGGTYPLSEMHDQYTKFFVLAERKVSFHHVLRGRDYLLRYLSQGIQRFGYPQIGYELGITNTAASLPTMGRKGYYTPETVCAKPWRHPLPDLPGQRLQRTKHRPLNQDPVQNVRYIEGVLTAVRKWLSTHFPEFFGSWLNPDLVVNPTITEHVLRRDYGVETDYDTCDAHFSVHIWFEVLRPVYELLIPDKMEFLKFAAFIEELFSQPIYMGNYLMTGLHNLLSGQAITNDFETIYDVINALGALLRNGFSVEDHPILTLGDDVALLGYKTQREALIMRDSFMEEAILNGMKFSEEKCKVEKGVIRYLRRLYTPGCGTIRYNCYGAGFLRGAYPAVLTLNSIINPEHRTSKDFNQRCAALLARLDNLDGNPFASTFITWLISRIEPLNADTREVDRIVLERDWWAKLFNDPWSLQKSYSWTVIKQQQLGKRLFSD